MPHSLTFGPPHTPPSCMRREVLDVTIQALFDVEEVVPRVGVDVGGRYDKSVDEPVWVRDHIMKCGWQAGVGNRWVGCLGLIFV